MFMTSALRLALLNDTTIALFSSNNELMLYVFFESMLFCDNTTLI
jgi:NADH:ubiquinone oxidoreductase subunit 4 (subunit M)